MPDEVPGTKYVSILVGGPLVFVGFFENPRQSLARVGSLGSGLGLWLGFGLSWVDALSRFQKHQNLTKHQNRP